MRHSLRFGHWLVAGLMAITVSALPLSSWATNSATHAATSPSAGVEPKAGKWQTWLLKSGSELRPAAPPDKAATDLEIKEIHKLTVQRDAKTLSQIAYWDAGSPAYRWQNIALAQVVKTPTPPHRAARMLALMNVAIYDALVVAWDAKYAYNRSRPSQLDAKLSLAVALPDSPSYPSEHAVAASAAAAVLSYIYPADAKMFEALAQQAGQSRVLAGVQYPSDVAAGWALGRAVAAKAIERGKADGSDAKWTGSVPPGRARGWARTRSNPWLQPGSPGC
ncbi:MAG: phosphatase PAP2 family protein [Anaerolineae bacterium]|nr:phosphatase PAP2 family protein [Anaerolineae bacterium]